MLGTIINVITAPGETFETIVKDFNWKQALIPLLLLITLSVVSGIVLKEQIAKTFYENNQKGIMQNTQMTDEQKESALSQTYNGLYDEFDEPRTMANLTITAFATISLVLKILFWSLFSMLVGNLFLGGGGTFNRVFTIASFAYLPTAIDYIIKTPIMYWTDNMMIFTGLGVLGVGEQGEFFNSFLARIDLFAFWRVYLMALGFSILYNKPSNSALITLAGLWIFGIIVSSGMNPLLAYLFG